MELSRLTTLLLLLLELVPARQGTSSSSNADCLRLLPRVPLQLLAETEREQASSWLSKPPVERLWCKAPRGGVEKPSG